jgi:hypothetical protein
MAGNLHDGMMVFSSDGKPIGRVIRYADDTLVIDRGVVVKGDRAIGLDDIARVHDDRVWLRLTAAELKEGGEVLEHEQPAPR